MSLLTRTLDEAKARFHAEVGAIESRAQEIAQLDHLQTALRARGWNAVANVAAEPLGSGARCHLQLHLSTTLAELMAAIEWMASEGVHATRVLLDFHSAASLRRYQLLAGSSRIDLSAYVHRAKEAA